MSLFQKKHPLKLYHGPVEILKGGMTSLRRHVTRLIEAQSLLVKL